MENGVRFPIVVHPIDGEALEEVTTALEEILQRREHERLAEAPRTGDEEEGVPIPRDERIEQRRFVHITIALLPHNAEVIGSLRDFFFFHGQTPSPQYSKRAVLPPRRTGTGNTVWKVYDVFAHSERGCGPPPCAPLGGAARAQKKGMKKSAPCCILGVNQTP